MEDFKFTILRIYEFINLQIYEFVNSRTCKTLSLRLDTEMVQTLSKLFIDYPITCKALRPPIFKITMPITSITIYVDVNILPLCNVGVWPWLKVPARGLLTCLLCTTFSPCPVTK